MVHYWLVGMRGGERVLEQILHCFPDADVFTHVYDPEAVSRLIRERRVSQTFVGRLPGARRHYQKYLALMPRALEELDLRGYDLVISSESGPAKGVIAPPTARHVCYCHTPMRYIYDHYPDYSAQLGPIARFYFAQLAHRLRQWDAASALRVDAFVANSSFVAQRIRRVYGARSEIVHPPVDLDAFAPRPAPRRDYYLAVSELVRYKRVDLAIEAVRGADRRLKVVGDGPELARLRRAAPPNVEFLGRVPTAALPGLYADARALLFPGEEDFGIVPVEAMACGAPVIAYGRGGARDSVVDGVTGLFFDAQTPEAIRHAVDAFEGMTFDPATIAARAAAFAPARFRDAFARVVDRVMAEAP